MTRKTNQKTAAADAVEVDQADQEALEARRKATEELMATPEMQAAMAEGRLALEAEMVAQQSAKAAQQPSAPGVDEYPVEGHEDETVVFGQPPAGAALAPGGSPSGPVWSAPAKMAVPPRDPENAFDLGSVVDVEVRLYSDRAGYRFVLVQDGVEDILWTGTNIDGWAGLVAMRLVKIDEAADWASFNQLPKVHDAEHRRQEYLDRWRTSLPRHRDREGGGRQVYRDYDVTGQPTSYSDGVSTGSRSNRAYQKEAVGAGGDGPGPGPGGALVREPAPGFGERHGLHQARWNALRALRLAGERGAQTVDRSSGRLTGAGDDGQREHSAPAAANRYGDADGHPPMIAGYQLAFGCRDLRRAPERRDTMAFDLISRSETLRTDYCDLPWMSIQALLTVIPAS
jgi:hypothetical protein